ncbi:nuclear transport factor 2 family protein [Nonomuraea turkmeniaca]|uniref:Nuclear transport factor 2 family protein n=1 Tax=Nonomuraea turkmeniaca TaxID=103838 RepID=A0A5S4G352_9ACTN|nr:nuclear transport factor 2 family protein [Nonomuraea turkmeniaca]TMR20241.1 nuclear transport factor 2 family protein [Nonomuraea turkmeniaca]
MPEDHQVSDALADAVNDHALERVLRLYGPGAVFVAPGGMAEGHEQIASFYASWFDGFPDVSATLWRKITTASVTVLEWTLTGTHRGPFLIPGGEILEPTGRRVAVRGCSTADLDGGLIVSHHIYFDQLQVFASLGLRLIPENAF